VNSVDRAGIAADIERLRNERDIEARAELLHPVFEFHSLLAALGGALEIAGLS
jgi:hypothetical protein